MVGKPRTPQTITGNRETSLLEDFRKGRFFAFPCCPSYWFIAQTENSLSFKMKSTLPTRLALFPCPASVQKVSSMSQCSASDGHAFSVTMNLLSSPREKITPTTTFLAPYSSSSNLSSSVTLK